MYGAWRIRAGAPCAAARLSLSDVWHMASRSWCTMRRRVCELIGRMAHGVSELCTMRRCAFEFIGRMAHGVSELCTMRRRAFELIRCMAHGVSELACHAQCFSLKPSFYGEV
ncbi:hypothetical protein Hanom_Chr12g01095371 [Helianthus anomalus]